MGKVVVYLLHEIQHKESRKINKQREKFQIRQRDTVSYTNLNKLDISDFSNSSKNLVGTKDLLATKIKRFLL